MIRIFICSKYSQSIWVYLKGPNIIFLKRNEPPRDKTNKVACAPSEDSYEPEHSLISLHCVFYG